MGNFKESNVKTHNNARIEERARAKSRFASKRADGSINTHPQERMRYSSSRRNEL
ncbi:small, acid-soluble spore protein K [Ectobacillus ponti]|uniref:Small, acid-soluble spore protein K n=1 Tax=Ectobacillus ponti TaxID=2961894 RepID=A0AA41XC64_9BACI|nr:small, acid-soluble spore protein K [Ectobacillus ponti]MCP8970983.1 small, acid-soluble spore protein K [Ectobacillus ponti]